MAIQSLRSFWRDALSIQGSMLPAVLPGILTCGGIALAACVVSWVADRYCGYRLDLEANPFEYIGAFLGVLLVLRTNAGNERWWEGRKLWGGIVNQSRNLTIAALAYGPADPAWRRQFVAWAAAFPHVARNSLRAEKPGPEVAALIGAEAYQRLAGSDHMPSFVAMVLAELLRDACARKEMDSLAFLQADRERALLIDHVGACERILKTPLPLGYAIMIRRFIAAFLVVLPFVLLHKLGSEWAVPIVTMLIAYLLLSLDQIGVELQNPFVTENLYHLPLNEITATIERNLTALLDETPLAFRGVSEPRT